MPIFVAIAGIFLDAGFIIIVPLVHGLARKTGRALLYDAFHYKTSQNKNYRIVKSIRRPHFFCLLFIGRFVNFESTCKRRGGADFVIHST